MAWRWWITCCTRHTDVLSIHRRHGNVYMLRTSTCEVRTSTNKYCVSLLWCPVNYKNEFFAVCFTRKFILPILLICTRETPSNANSFVIISVGKHCLGLNFEPTLACSVRPSLTYTSTNLAISIHSQGKIQSPRFLHVVWAPWYQWPFMVYCVYVNR